MLQLLVSVRLFRLFVLQPPDQPSLKTIFRFQVCLLLQHYILLTLNKSVKVMFPSAHICFASHFSIYTLQERFPSFSPFSAFLHFSEIILSLPKLSTSLLSPVLIHTSLFLCYAFHSIYFSLCFLIQTICLPVSTLKPQLIQHFSINTPRP